MQPPSRRPNIGAHWQTFLTLGFLSPLFCLQRFSKLKWLNTVDIHSISLFSQRDNHAQTDFGDYNKQYLLDPVCIFIVFVNSVLTSFLKMFQLCLPLRRHPAPPPPVRNLQELPHLSFHCSFVLRCILYRNGTLD